MGEARERRKVGQQAKMLLLQSGQSPPLPPRADALRGSVGSGRSGEQPSWPAASVASVASPIGLFASDGTRLGAAERGSKGRVRGNLRA